jgi:putative hydrolase of the HAD superfamily
MNTIQTTPSPAVDFCWEEIETVLLDMDGTLLDKYFDDYFWEKYVPEMFARKNNLSAGKAEEALLARYRCVESTLQWTDLDYWTEQLGLDIPQLKCDIDHLIKVHPHVLEFLDFIQSSSKNLHLVTNAHSKTLAIKLAKSGIAPFFDRIICAEEIGEAKEHPAFWPRLEGLLGFDKRSTMLADDTTKVLRCAEAFGIRHLIHVARPSSRLPVNFSKEYPSIVNFNELMGR